MKHGTIIPLIGGMTLAAKNATGTDPSFMLSYSDFRHNDNSAREYFKNTPYFNLSESPVINGDLFNDVDFVNAVPPCAGLSMSNPSKTRGSDSTHNRWLYESSNYVLSNIKPKVFFGENAPGLFTNAGEGVFNKLVEIGKSHGYSFSLVKTDTILHGIPQHRKRTFFFFWNSKTAPILNWVNKPVENLSSYLKRIPTNSSQKDIPFAPMILTEDPIYNFAKYRGETHASLMNNSYDTLFQWITGENLLDELIDFCKTRYKRYSEILEYKKTKLEAGLGHWDCTPIFRKNKINALIRKNLYTIHPDEERVINIREAMHLMGLPHDFEFKGKTIYEICQNVPVSTAQDWTSQVIDFCNGKLKQSDVTVIKQNNETRKIDFISSKKQLF